MRIDIQNQTYYEIFGYKVLPIPNGWMLTNQ
jgi:hypothetical protein